MIGLARRASRRGRMGRCLTGCAVAALLVGCTMVGPDYQPPRTEMPDLWEQAMTRGLVEGKADLRTWWTVFDDPMLDSLIARANKGNLDVKRAVARIREARAQLGIAAGELYPGVDGLGTVERSRLSEGISKSDPAPPQSRTDTFYAAGLDASWELDFWGRIRRNVESADAAIGATVEDYRDVLVVLYADVASNYVGARTLQARIESALSNVKTQEGALRLTKDRNRAGLAPDLDVRQAELNLARTEAAVPALRERLKQTINRLGVLLGEFPSALEAELGEPTAIPKPPGEVLVGLPSELLRQRPDVRAAERALASQNAQIGVATAELYPQFSLSGTFALEAFSASNFLDWGSRSWSFGPAFRWNLFNAGRVRSNINVQDARTEQLLVDYQQSVLNAVEDVENSMVSYVQEQERRDALERSVVAARESVRLVDTLYRTGLTDFQNVLDMQRSQFEQEDQYEQSLGQVSQNLIRVYRSLGGGWAPAAEEDTPATTTASAPGAGTAVTRPAAYQGRS